MKKTWFSLAAAIWVFLPSDAMAQCSGQFAASMVCGNLTGIAALPKPSLVGTAITANTGTSGHTLPFLDGLNTFSRTIRSDITGTSGADTIIGLNLNRIYTDVGDEEAIDFGDAGSTRMGRLSIKPTSTGEGAFLIYLQTSGGDAAGNNVARFGTGELNIFPAPSTGATLQLGIAGVNGVPFIDFHSDVANSNFGVRLLAHGSDSADGSGTLDMNGTFNIVTVPNTLHQALVTNSSGHGTVNGEISFNEIKVTADDSSTTLFNNTATAFRIRYGFGGAAMSGSRSGLEINADYSGASPSTSNDNYGGAYINMNARTSAGGTDTGSGALGVFYALNPVVRGLPGATNLRGLVGAEVDLQLNNGATAQSVHGFDMALFSEHQASLEDVVMNFYSASTAAAWTKGIQLKSVGGPPITATGCFLCTDGAAVTISTYAEAAAYNFTDFIFRFKNFQVTGAGIVSAGTYIASTAVAHTASYQFTDTISNGFFGASSFLTNSVAIGSLNSVPVAFFANNAFAGSISTAGVWEIGLTGTLTGQMGFSGATSGIAVITAQAAAGTPTLMLPNASGTFAVSASGSLVLNATTGALTCPTCGTSTLTNTHIFVGNVSNAATDVAMSGDATMANTGALTIAANAITLSKLATQATNTVLGNATSSSAVPTALPVVTCATASSALIWVTNTGFSCNTSITAAAVPASGLTGTTLASGVVTSSLTSVGTLTGGSTGAGFTVALGTSTITGLLAGTNGGTGVNNGASTITIGGNVTHSGAFTTTITVTATTNSTLPAGTHTLAGLDVVQTWTAAQSFASGDLKLNGATSGSITINAAGTAGSNTITLPAGTTDFSATGGASQVVKQTSSGGAFTVATIAFTDITGTNSIAQLGGSGAAHATLIDVAGAATWKVIPDCTDTTGNHLNYTQSSDAFSCGTTVGAAAAGTLTGTTLNATVVTSSLTSLGTITTLNATTINAHTLGGSISGAGNTITNLASVGIRDTSAAFDVTIAATSSAALTAGRTLTLNMGNVAHTLAFGTTANTITFPNVASGTVAMLNAANTFNVAGTNTFKSTTTYSLSVQGGAGGTSYILLDTFSAAEQNGIFMADNGSLKWLFSKNADLSFSFVDVVSGIFAISVVPGASTVGSVSIGYATDATSVSTGAIKNPGGMSVNKRVWMNGLSAAGAGLSAACVENTGEITQNTGVTNCLISAREWKTNIRTLPDSSDLLLALKPHLFDWRDPSNGDKNQIGFIADEVALVDNRLAEFGTVMGKPAWSSWRPEMVTTLLVQGYQLHDAKISALKESVDNFEARLRSLEAGAMQ